jgi:iron complex outermembrane recepter protein
MKRLVIAVSIGLIGAVDFPLAVAADASTVSLEQVVVTAQRREESAQKVGVAISVLSGDELAERGVRNVNQLQDQVPSLEVEPAFGGGQPQFRIRGVGFQDYASNNSSTVGIYVDEVAYPLPVQTQGLLFDLDRVEVLRGPQGTLYGRNTTGGAINFLSRKPTKTFETGVTVGYGSYNEKTLEAYLSGPFSEALRGRFSFATQQGGGWQHNRVTGETLGDKDISALRGQLELDATRDLKINLNAHYGQDKSDSQGLYLFAAHGAQAADSDRKATGWGLKPTFARDTGLAAGSKPSRDNQSDGVALTVNWDLDAVKLTSITSNENFRRREFSDWDGTSLAQADTYWHSDARVFSQELRLASNKPARFNWLGGLYYAKEKLDEKFYSDFSQSLSLPTVLTQYSQEAETKSVFGQVDYLLADRLKVIAGLRHEKENRELQNLTTRFAASPVFFVPLSNRSLDTEATSGKLGLEYQWTNSSLLYGTVSRGVKSGGFTAYNTTSLAQLTPFLPETVWSYETGFKSDLSSNLRLNGALFHYDYHNQQVLGAVLDPISGSFIGKIVNAPKSEINGAELELEWRPLNGLKITQALGYKEGHFKEYHSNLVGDQSGHPLFFPKLSYGGSATYGWSAKDYRLKLQGDYSYHDTYKSWLNDLDPSTSYDVKSYWLANARLEVLPPDSRWSVAAYVRNIFDQKYDLTRNFFLPGLPVAAAGQPRTVGVQLSVAY